VADLKAGSMLVKQLPKIVVTAIDVISPPPTFGEKVFGTVLGESTAGAQPTRSLRDRENQSGSRHFAKVGRPTHQAERAKQLEIGLQKKLWTYQGLAFSPDATKGQLILDEIASRPC